MTRRNKWVGAAAVAAFLAAILAANMATTRYGFIPVGFGESATAGTLFAGACFVLRDLVDDRLGRAGVLIAVAAGSALSAVLGDGRIALASAAAFVVSELADYAVYRPLRSHGYIRAALASNTVGAVIDTILFLTVAGFPVWTAVPGQMIGKAWATAAVIAAVVITRVVSREPVHAEGRGSDA